MFPPTAVAEEILRATANAVRRGDRAALREIDDVPVSVYAIDLNGILTYYNPHCVAFAGRKPVLGQDCWCVSWKLYTEDGVFLPHDQCPMALVLRQRVPIRGVRAVVERPNGTRAVFAPFPTPIFQDDGTLAGAVNMLIDLSEREQAMFEGLHGEGFAPWQRAAIERELGALSIDDVKALVAEIENEVGRQRPRVLN